MKLTVIIRDDSPLFVANDSPRFRTVVIELTDSQKEQIKLNQTGTNRGNAIHESISQCILEG